MASRKRKAKVPNIDSYAPRTLIVKNDDGYWYVRHVYIVEYDAVNDHTVYRCDHPIGRRFNCLSSALWAAHRSKKLRNLASHGRARGRKR